MTGRRNHLFRRTKRAIYFAHPQLNLVGQFMEPESGPGIAGFIRQAMAFDDLVLDSDQMTRTSRLRTSRGRDLAKPTPSEGFSLTCSHRLWEWSLDSVSRPTSE